MKQNETIWNKAKQSETKYCIVFHISPDQEQAIGYILSWQKLDSYVPKKKKKNGKM